MEIIVEGKTAETMGELEMYGICTEEPGDNCWLQLD